MRLPERVLNKARKLAWRWRAGRVPPDRRIAVRPYRPGDERLICRMFREVYGEKRSLDHWNWKFVENLIGGAPIVLGFDGERGFPCGHYALCPVFLDIGEDTLSGAQSLDTMVREGYQGRGLMVRLAEECYKAAEGMGIKVIYGYPNEKSYRPLVDRLGFTDVGTIPLYRKELTGRETGWQRDEDGWEVEGISRVEEAFGDLWVSVRGKNRVGVARDHKYLNWRYGRFPDTRYHQLAFRLRGELAGYVVAAMRNRSGIVADFLALRPDYTRNFMRYLEGYLAAGGCRDVSFHIRSRGGEEDILVEEGYRRSDSKLVLAVRTLGDASMPPGLADIDSWYVTFGDCDGI